MLSYYALEFHQTEVKNMAKQENHLDNQSKKRYYPIRDAENPKKV
ncbi:hypothetical protein HMPREF1150_0387 [Streptococcus sp. AS14]|jgi:hypothetical protein|nr:hypothetical protein HMPREF1150_0387 [Streptococcus sp. AS14]